MEPPTPARCAGPGTPAARFPEPTRPPRVGDCRVGGGHVEEGINRLSGRPQLQFIRYYQDEPVTLVVVIDPDTGLLAKTYFKPTKENALQNARQGVLVYRK